MGAEFSGYTCTRSIEQIVFVDRNSLAFYLFNVLSAKKSAVRVFNFFSTMEDCKFETTMVASMHFSAAIVPPVVHQSIAVLIELKVQELEDTI